MHKRYIAAAGAALMTLTIGLAGCSSDTESTAAAETTTETTVEGPGVAAAPTSPERVDAVGFSEVVASPGVQIIDVRTPQEFAEGHIEGAVNYNVEGPDFLNQIAGLDPAGTYAVYCRSGNRSQVAVAEMSNAGINGIYELESGITGWQGAGLPVVQ